MTLRPRRQGMSLGEFEDPLENYEPVSCVDEVERALTEDVVASMTIAPYRTVLATTPVRKTVELMIELDVACVLVVDESDHLVGIFSERDVMTKLAESFEALQNEPVSRFMTPNPTVVYDTDSPAKALNLMAVGGFRHIPVVDLDERVVGILGPRRVTHYLDQVLHGRG